MSPIGGISDPHQACDAEITRLHADNRALTEENLRWKVQVERLTRKLDEARSATRQLAEVHMYCDGLIGKERARLAQGRVSVNEAHDLVNRDGVILKGPVLRVLGDALRALEEPPK